MDRPRYYGPLNSLLAAVGTALGLAAIYSGCGHDVSPAQGFTTVHFNGPAESMQAIQKMTLLDQLADPRVFTAPTGSTGGIMVFAQLIGGGFGSFFVPPGGGGSWTLSNGAYTFSAVGYDGASGSTMNFTTNGPYCGLALGDNGQRGSPDVLAGNSRTIDILMGTTLTSGSSGAGPSGSATQGTFGNPTCGMTPFMFPDSGGSSGCSTGAGTCFMPKLAMIGVCTGNANSPANQGLPAGNDTSGSSATTCSALNGPSGGSGVATSPTGASAVASLRVQFLPINAFIPGAGNPLPPMPPSLNNSLSSPCASVAGGTGITTAGVVPLFPTGGGSQAVGGPSQFVGGPAANFSLTTAISVYADASCGTWLRTYLFPYGVSNTNGSQSAGISGPGAPIYIDSSAPSVRNSAAGTMAGFWVSGNVPTAGKLWIQYP